MGQQIPVQSQVKHSFNNSRTKSCKTRRATSIIMTLEIVASIMKKSQRIGPYTLISPLGGHRPGHSGVRSWLAYAGETGTRLVLKLAEPDDEVGRARLMHEVDLAAGFDHPNIVRIFECAEARRILWIAMAWVPGPHAPLKLANFRQLLLALVHVHANQVVHAALSPRHLLLDEEGDLKLVNFSQARRMVDGGMPARGELAWMPPEQLRGQALDARSDVFSAGAVLYHILCGRAPFEGGAAMEMPQLADAGPAPPSQLAPGLGDSFDALVRTALAREPSERFASAFEFLGAFDAACKRGVPAPA